MSPLVDLVLFDMDGVLADTEPLHLEAANRILAPEGVRLLPEETVEFLGNTDADFFSTIKERHGLSRPVAEYVQAKMVETIGLVRSGLVPSPGVCELLVGLKMRGVRSVVASSSAPQLIDSVVDCLGMRSSFDGLFSACEVARGKPHPDLFEHAARTMGVDPAACIVIEDAPAGIQAARVAGMQVVAVRTRLTHGLDLSAADRVLNRLTEFDYEMLDGC